MSFRSGSAEDVAGEERSGKRQTGGNGQRPGGGCADGGKICRFRKEVKRENRCDAGRNFPVTVPFDRISTVKKREERRGAYNEGRRYCWQCLLCASVFYPALSDRRFQRLTCACPLHVRCRCRKRASGIRNIERPAGLTPGRPLSDVPGCLCLFSPSYDMVTAAPAPMALCEQQFPERLMDHQAAVPCQYPTNADALILGGISSSRWTCSGQHSASAGFTPVHAQSFHDISPPVLFSMEDLSAMERSKYPVICRSLRVPNLVSPMENFFFLPGAQLSDRSFLGQITRNNNS